MKGHRFKPGDEVAHKENTEQVMFVKRILKKILKSTDNSLPDKIIMVGVECHWWENKVLKTGRFHSHELVPYDIVKKGKEAVSEWINA